MKRYSEYKDSGVKWIGEIPGHWKICRTRYLCNINTGDKDTVMKEDNGKYPFYVRSPKIERINTFSYDGEAILMAGDGVGAGKVFHYANGKFDYHQRVYNMHNICGVSGKFMFYFIRDQFHYAMEEKNAKSTVDSVRLPWLKAFPIAIPAQEEQEAIVTYLDTKVAKIDEYISIAEKKIAALEELKQTIIAEAVTRGIHKEVPMKDSGVKWIGMIPEHWKVLCLKYLSKIKGRIGYRGYTAADLVSEGEGAFVIGGKHINQCILNTESPDYISWDKYYESPEIMVSKGDIVMAQRGSLGKVALIDKEINEATINPSLVLIKDICCDASFLYFYLRSNSTLTLIELLNTATAVPMISQKQIEKMPIPLPPLPEQQEIVTYIEAKVANINQLCQAERSQIEKLKEYKQRLISDVVTGKVKVTND